MTRLFPALLVLPLLSLLPQQSRAESELYGGVGVGYSTFKIDSLDFEASAYANREFLGFRYGDYVGVELGYTDFGTAKDRIAVPPDPESFNYRVETSGYDLSLMGRYPLDEELAAFGKVGVIRWESDATGSFPLSANTDGNDLIWGLGLDYRGAGRFHIRIEADLMDIEFANSWWELSTSVIYGIPFAR